MKKLTVLMLAASLTMGASVVYAVDGTTAAQNNAQQSTAPMQHHNMKRGMHNGGNDRMKGYHNGMFAGINLSTTQRNQIDTITNDARNAHHESGWKGCMGMGMGMGYSQDTHKLIAADSFDETAARAQIESTSKARNDMMLEHMKMENKMYNILTPEQKKQFNQNYEQRLKSEQGNTNNTNQ